MPKPENTIHCLKSERMAHAGWRYNTATQQPSDDWEPSGAAFQTPNFSFFFWRGVENQARRGIVGTVGNCAGNVCASGEWYAPPPSRRPPKKFSMLPTGI